MAKVRFPAILNVSPFPSLFWRYNSPPPFYPPFSSPTSYYCAKGINTSERMKKRSLWVDENHARSTKYICYTQCPVVNKWLPEECPAAEAGACPVIQMVGFRFAATDWADLGPLGLRLSPRFWAVRRLSLHWWARRGVFHLWRALFFSSDVTAALSMANAF